MHGKGDRGELLAGEQLVAHGWEVSIPYGHNHHYDIVADKGGVFLRLQIKSTLAPVKSRTRPGLHFQFACSRGRSGRLRYDEKDFDFFILVALSPVHRFWIVPFHEVTCRSVKIGDGNNKYKQYEDAWNLLDEASD